MDGIVAATMGMRADALSQAVSYSLMNKAMAAETQMMNSLLEQLPQVGAKAPVMQGEVGFNLDVFA